ncbi:type I restriction enzyme HsdR N-terminal domain-containing protein [Pedobacter sp. SD-b]|uniref:Type I restriction enzyme HsdR N-terminal domain-containing protein n=1 Tax=Pedobacter segetis TaxID=2793069 RepID=A0ABS1BIB8_9SPHI|nr:type I restriction enzyme HsdR N-terminal domain-containing protein [Pedobacter segetis]MBK0382615.1 type I restriction enzyme HsdR N-terminal domain-containing protein [Pedobacter segetis]
MFKPVPLNLPHYPFKLSQKNGSIFIFDELRKKDLLLTPEEWVRQHFVQYLINEKKYPKTLIKLEGGLKLNKLQKRTDILIFDKEGKPNVLVECKATSVKIDQKVFDQAASYNMIHRVDYLMVSNGINHYCCLMDYKKQSYRFLEELPDYLLS